LLDEKMNAPAVDLSLHVPALTKIMAKSSSQHPASAAKLAEKSGLDEATVNAVLDLMYDSKAINQAQVTRNDITQRMVWPSGVIVHNHQYRTNQAKSSKGGAALREAHRSTSAIRESLKPQAMPTAGALAEAKQTIAKEETMTKPINPKKDALLLMLQCMRDTGGATGSQLRTAAGVKTTQSYIRRPINDGDVVLVKPPIGKRPIYKIALGKTVEEIYAKKGAWRDRKQQKITIGTNEVNVPKFGEKVRTQPRLLMKKQSFESTRALPPEPDCFCSKCGQSLLEPVTLLSIEESVGNEVSLREMQLNLPWTIRYSQDYRTSPITHKDFAHALHHVSKAAGRLHGLADDMDHDRQLADDPNLRNQYGKYIADLVICALRCSNVFPGGVIDLQHTVQQRIKQKNVIPDLSTQEA
jgi:hypothetical protein